MNKANTWRQFVMEIVLIYSGEGTVHPKYIDTYDLSELCTPKFSMTLKRALMKHKG